MFCRMQEIVCHTLEFRSGVIIGESGEVTGVLDLQCGWLGCDSVTYVIFIYECCIRFAVFPCVRLCMNLCLLVS